LIKRIERLDDKATNIMSVAGVLVALVSGPWKSVSTAQKNVIGAIVVATFIGSLLLLLASFWFD